MCRALKTVLFLNILIFDCIVSAPSVSFVPVKSKSDEVESKLSKVLSDIYDNLVKNGNLVKNDENSVKSTDQSKKNADVYDGMQGDQPVAENTISQNLQAVTANFTYQGDTNFSNTEYVKAIRNMDKEKWMEVIKENILKQIGRKNTTIPRGTIKPKMNFEPLENILNSTGSSVPDDQIAEKIRGFYPSCDLPTNTDQDLWKNDDMMNLLFSFDYGPEDSNIATATLRLYRIPENNTQSNAKKSQDCADPPVADEDKLLRVSVYWYTKSLRKRRIGGVKRRLADSKVIPESAEYVELNVKPATKAWLKGKNLGLGVMVDDQEGNVLSTEKYFKGASCMVGESTPKPLPTIVRVAAEQSSEYNQHLGGNSTSSLHSDKLLPTLDVCTLKFPENYTQPEHIMNLRVNACNLKTLYDQRQKQLERERNERLTTLPEYLVHNSRHIRHQRQHLANKMSEEERANRNFDPRSMMVNSKVILRHDELMSLAQKDNLSMTNR